MYKYLILVILISNYSFANGPSDHAPIGVMGEHLHSKGEIMTSYRYMSMSMNGNNSSGARVSNQEVLNDFMVTPTDMEMEMHMLGLMYAPSDSLTLMAMVPYVELSMNHLTRNGTVFETNSSGIGDLKVSGLYNLLDTAFFSDFKDSSGHTNFIANFGVSLPTGSINARDDIPVADDVRLPYPMQIGSGTFDFMPGLTFTKKISSFSFGAQGIGTIRVDRNDNDYSLGDRFDSSFWTSFDFSTWLSASVRGSWRIWGNVNGADPELNPGMVPTADPHRRGGRRFDVGLGLNLLIPQTSFRLAMEYLSPVYQNLDGPQLAVDRTWVFGAQMTF